MNDRSAGLSNDEACWEAAKRIREERPGWVVIWLARANQFKAYPKFRAPRGTAPAARTPEDLAAQMEEIEQAGCRPMS